MRIIAWARRHPWVSGLTVAGLACMSCPVMIIVILINARVSGKSAAWRSPNLPAVRSGAGQPILQLESHTCGLLSLSAAYELYDLSPEDKNLRFRLGVDVPANMFDSESKGTLHPDLLRVLVQDGFAYELPSPVDDGKSRLINHLQSGNVALLLIRRRETGGLHWVLADSVDGDNLRIVDSLSPQPVREPIDEWFDECMLSIILIKPAAADFIADVAKAHRDGVAEMINVNQRIGQLRTPRN